MSFRRTRKARTLLLASACLVALVVGETGFLEFSYSRMVSGTRLDSARKAVSTGDLASTVGIERPATRWLPFIKFGETVYRRTYQDRAENGVVFEHVVTTRTSMWVVGLCSIARYDRLADKPFEDSLKRYQARR
jgi:hypothetical protein